MCEFRATIVYCCMLSFFRWFSVVPASCAVWYYQSPDNDRFSFKTFNYVSVFFLRFQCLKFSVQFSQVILVVSPKFRFLELWCALTLWRLNLAEKVIKAGAHGCLTLFVFFLCRSSCAGTVSASGHISFILYKHHISSFKCSYYFNVMCICIGFL
jgi:hypothetical protein